MLLVGFARATRLNDVYTSAATDRWEGGMGFGPLSSAAQKLLYAHSSGASQNLALLYVCMPYCCQRHSVFLMYVERPLSAMLPYVQREADMPSSASDDPSIETAEGSGQKAGK